jgi:myo-inositol-1(or 4)-monophosphatase
MDTPMSLLPVNFTLQKLALLCVDGAKLGAEVAKRHFLQDYAISTKPDTSLVTAADIAAEYAIRDFFANTSSFIGFEGEETGLELNTQKLRWRIDPIDGTDNFVIGIPVFSTTVALVSENECLCGAIVNPITNQVYSVEQAAGAFLNGNQLQAQTFSDGKHTRVAFIPDYSSKRNPFVRQLLDELRNTVFRVVDSWAPALDWCSLATGHIDAILQVSSLPPTPNAGYLLAAKSGRMFRSHTLRQPDQSELYVLIAATTAEHCAQIEKLLLDQKDKS